MLCGDTAEIYGPGDTHLLYAARSQARNGFDKHRSLEASSKEATDGITHAEGVAEVLKHNIVQGKQVDGTDKLSTRHKMVATCGRWLIRRPELRIHEHTERGDNDTVKNPLGKGGVVKVAGGNG
jgi:complex III assembly factor LYRM7